MKKEQMKTRVDELTEKKVLEAMEVDVEKMDLATFGAKVSQAKLGMEYLRDKKTNERIEVGQEIRIVTLVCMTPEERKKLLKEKGFLN